MNILVIGNGFDLAHGLPTLYQDFIEFADNYTNYSKYMSDKLISEMRNIVSDNKWLNHFKTFYENNGWIEFEKEISDIIKILDKKIPEFEKIKEGEANRVKFNVKERQKLKCFDFTILQASIYDENYIQKIKKKMLNDLNKLIRGLEIYLDYFVNRIPISEFCPGIIYLYIDKVLSFNYTKTYERIYDVSRHKNIEYDYIHGKADIWNTIETNNMVLGIDEYLPEDRRNKDVEFIAFKKYYQRIHKQTSCKYKEWVDQIREEWDHETEESKAEIRKCISKRKLDNPKIHKLYIFGHSLDVTDKDILRDLILNDNVYTTIFYHNKDVMGQKIENLVKVIGQDEVIKRTAGSTKTIEFEQQMYMEKRNSLRTIGIIQPHKISFKPTIHTIPQSISPKPTIQKI